MSDGRDDKAAGSPATRTLGADAQRNDLEPTLTDAGRSQHVDNAAVRWLAELARARGQPWADLAPGTIIGGSYRVVRYLGSGGMGVVYLARDLELQRNVAVKLHLGTGGIERLQREAMAMAQLAHPNVVTVYAVGRYEGQAYVAMEYVPGTTLHGWVRAAPRPWRDVMTLMLAAGEGLAAAHDAGFVHRDIKPGNILVGADDRPRLVDFGLVHVPDEGELPRIADPLTPSREPLCLTETGEVLGTPAYMAPEQLAGRIVDARADQFAYCLAFYEALYGRRPWHAITSAELRRSMMEDPPARPPRGLAPPWLWRVLRRGLARDPDARYPDMRALLAALRRPPRPRVWIALAAAITVTAAVGAAVAWRVGSSRGPCDAVDGPVSALWTDDARRAMATRFAMVDPTSGRDIATRLAGRLDRWTDRWRRTATAACGARAHRAPALAAASERCLHASTTRLRSLLSRAATASSTAVVADLLEDGEHRLPWVEECNDERRLATIWSATAPAHATPAPTDGYWVGNFGRLTLRELGDEIWGVYDHDDGTVRGRMIGDRFVGWWCEVPSRRPDSDAGAIELRFLTDPDGTRRVDGRWRYGTAGAWDEQWDLVWSSDEAPAELRARFADAEQFCAAP